MTSPGAPAEAPRISRWEHATVVALLIYLAGRLVFLALRVDPTIPPDETTHFGRVVIYARVPFVPEDGGDTVILGLVGHRPYLYYWLMARALALNVFGWNDLLYLRLINAALGIATAACAVGFARRVLDNAWLRTAFLAALTNTLMLTGLFASVHYDNLANLLAVVCGWAFVTLLQTRQPRALATLILCLALGALTKRTFLPLAAIFTVVWGATEWRAVPDVLGRLGRDLRTGDRGLRGLCALGLVATLAVAGLYGANLVRFGRLLPTLEQVVGPRRAMQNRLHLRQFILKGLREGNLDMRQALALADRIGHAGDRRDLRYLLLERQHSDGTLLDLGRYSIMWVFIMSEGFWGYNGHERVLPSVWRMAPLWLVGVLGLAGLVLTGRSPPPARGGRVLAAVAILYAAVLLLVVHRPLYISSGNLGLAVQGRYLFPVLAPLYAAVAGGVAALWRGAAGVAAVVAAAVWIALADLPMLLARAPSTWWGGP